MKTKLFLIILTVIAALGVYSAFANSNNEKCVANAQFHRLECCVGDCDTIGAKVTLYNL